jgi:hypothetical protein
MSAYFYRRNWSRSQSFPGGKFFLEISGAAWILQAGTGVFAMANKTTGWNETFQPASPN